MSAKNHRRTRARTGALLMGAMVSATAAGAVLVPAEAASAATTGVSATFAAGALVVVGDNLDNTITISRDAAGQILVNGGAVTVQGGTPTIANARSISVSGGAGSDTLAMSEVNGALPAANLVGGNGSDTITGGSGADILIGQNGNDTLLGKGGDDQLFGGAGKDSLTGGVGTDQAFGEADADRMIWNPGEGTDLDEGGDGIDTVEVNGGNGAEQFTETANGTRVRFDRITPAPFSIDIGTSENLVLNAAGGDDTFDGTGNLAPLITTTVNGGSGNDSIRGTNGPDTLIGDVGTDFVDGQQGADRILLGADDDTMGWDPGDGSDIVEGGTGNDAMLFHGSPIGETLVVSAHGSRARLTRDVGAITMDFDDVEALDIDALAGADDVVVNDLSKTDLTSVDTDLSGLGGQDDLVADTVTVRGTSADDVVVVSSQGGGTLEVDGLAATVTVRGASPVGDQLHIETLAGNDVVDASGMAAGTAALTVDGGTKDDLLIGSAGSDTLTGGDGDDVLIGGPGVDVLDGGPGANVLIDGESLSRGVVADQAWLAAHTHTMGTMTTVEHDGTTVAVPTASLVG